MWQSALIIVLVCVVIAIVVWLIIDSYLETTGSSLMMHIFGPNSIPNVNNVTNEDTKEISSAAFFASSVMFNNRVSCRGLDMLSGVQRPNEIIATNSQGTSLTTVSNTIFVCPDRGDSSNSGFNEENPLPTVSEAIMKIPHSATGDISIIISQSVYDISVDGGVWDVSRVPNKVNIIGRRVSKTIIASECKSVVEPWSSFKTSDSVHVGEHIIIGSKRFIVSNLTKDNTVTVTGKFPASDSFEVSSILSKIMLSQPLRLVSRRETPLEISNIHFQHFRNPGKLECDSGPINFVGCTIVQGDFPKEFVFQSRRCKINMDWCSLVSSVDQKLYLSRESSISNTVFSKVSLVQNHASTVKLEDVGFHGHQKDVVIDMRGPGNTLKLDDVAFFEQEQKVVCIGMNLKNVVVASFLYIGSKVKDILTCGGKTSTFWVERMHSEDNRSLDNMLANPNGEINVFRSESVDFEDYFDVKV